MRTRRCAVQWRIEVAVGRGARHCASMYRVDAFAYRRPRTPPTAEEITDVAARTAQRVQKILARHGRTIDGIGESDAEEPRFRATSTSLFWFKIPNRHA